MICVLEHRATPAAPRRSSRWPRVDQLGQVETPTPGIWHHMAMPLHLCTMSCPQGSPRRLMACRTGTGWAWMPASRTRRSKTRLWGYLRHHHRCRRRTTISRAQLLNLSNPTLQTGMKIEEYLDRWELSVTSPQSALMH